MIHPVLLMSFAMLVDCQLQHLRKVRAKVITATWMEVEHVVSEETLGKLEVALILEPGLTSGV